MRTAFADGLDDSLMDMMELGLSQNEAATELGVQIDPLSSGT